MPVGFVCAKFRLLQFAVAFLVLAPISAAAEESLADLFVQRFPEVMNATLIERDCPGVRPDELRELAYYADALIHYAEDKPELAGGVDAVYRAGAEYDKQHYGAGASFCGKYADAIVAKGVESARAMGGRVGIAPYAAATVDLPVLEKSLEAASEAIGAADKCREVKRDTYAGVAGRFGGFMFFSSTVGEIRTEFAALKAFALKNGAAADLEARLGRLTADGKANGPEECSLNKYITLSSNLEALVKRYGLTP